MIINKILQFYVVLLIFNVNVYSQDYDFNIDLIPSELSDDSSSVIRFENNTIDMISQREMIITNEIAITIYNESDDDYADITIYYDSRRKIKSVKGYIYDSNGNEIKKIRKKDFNDYSATGGSLFTDNRVIHYDYTPTTYPYTIHYIYKVKTSNTAFIPGWILTNTYHQGIQKSNYTVKYPSDITLLKTETNFEGYDVKVTDEVGLLSYAYENIAPIIKEPNTPLLSSFLPYSKIGVNKFNLEGVDGEAENWKEFGKWYYNSLLKQTLDLPESTKRKIRDLTAHLSDPIDKAKFVYEYVQNKVRYISIQVGVGGFQPMLASDVDALSYGDCKGLSNYTKSLLDALDIPSNHVIIYGSRRKLDISKNFNSIQGNHMILTIPTEEGNIWLECTSQKHPFGEIAGFTDDRDVLVIKPEGGELMHTRTYKDKENSQFIKANYTIDSKGGFTAETSIVSKGTQLNRKIHKYEAKTKKELDKAFKEFWDNIDNMSISKMEVSNNKKEAQFEDLVSFTAQNYASISGERLIFPVNAFNVNTYIPKRVRNRKLPFEISRGFWDVDEVEISLPTGYKIETMSENIEIDTEFGTYKSTIEKISVNTLKYTREILLKSGDHQKESYDLYRSFWKQVKKGDNSKVVLIKK